MISRFHIFETLGRKERYRLASVMGIGQFRGRFKDEKPIPAVESLEKVNCSQGRDRHTWTILSLGIPFLGDSRALSAISLLDRCTCNTIDN